MITINTDKKMNVTIELTPGTTHGEMVIGCGLLAEALSFSSKKSITQVMKSIKAIALDQRKVRKEEAEGDEK